MQGIIFISMKIRNRSNGNILLESINAFNIINENISEFNKGGL
jgi:hypothetical protein